MITKTFLAVMAVFFLVVGYSCAHQNTLIGTCSIPPNQSEGYTLVSCSADPGDFSNLSCFYAKPMPYGLEVRQVQTTGCTGFEVTGQGVILK